jgi:hypothetical protein
MIADRIPPLRQWFREPLVHFLLLGAGLFLLYSLINNNTGDQPPNRIVVDEGQARRLAEQFQRTWIRPPTRQELEGLVEDYIKEEILYREALALGLDQDDLVIRRRMRQKMEFLNEDLVELQPPTDAQLQAFLKNHPDKFRRPGRLSFQQVYLNPERYDDGKARAMALLKRLNTAPTPASSAENVGDPTLLPYELTAVTLEEVARTFGSTLAEALTEASAGRWAGPFPSSYGLHLVRVTDRKAGNTPALEEIRSIVEREWLAERRMAVKNRFYETLRERYQVVVEMPEDATGEQLVSRQP